MCPGAWLLIVVSALSFILSTCNTTRTQQFSAAKRLARMEVLCVFLFNFTNTCTHAQPPRTWGKFLIDENKLCVLSCFFFLSITDCHVCSASWCAQPCREILSVLISTQWYECQWLVNTQRLCHSGDIFHLDCLKVESLKHSLEGKYFRIKAVIGFLSVSCLASRKVKICQHWIKRFLYHLGKISHEK